MRKILIECHHLLGDVVIMLPFLQKLQKVMPMAEIHMVVGSKNEEEIVKTTGIISKFYCLNKEKKIKIIFKLRKEKYDYGFACVNTNTIKGIIFLKLAGCKCTIGPERKGIIKHTFQIQNNECEHEVMRNLLLLSPFSSNISYENVVIELPNKILEKAAFLIEENLPNKKVVTLCVGTGNFFYYRRGHKIEYNCKNWGFNNFLKLANLLAEKHIKVILIGGKKEEQECIENLKQLRCSAGVQNLIGKTSIMESLGILKKSHLVIGCDTGMMHCAAVLGIATLSIFGATNPAVARPFSDRANIIQSNLHCSPCIKSYNPKNAKAPAVCKTKECLSLISIDMVFETAMRIILEG